MKKFNIFALLVTFLMLGSCTDGFEKMNANPNSPLDVPATNLLNSSINSGVRRIHGENLNFTYAALWSQQIAKIQYIDEDRYEYRPDAINNHWDGLYVGPLPDLQIIIEKSQASGSKKMEGAARIMRAYYFHTMTDLWGDIPYTEALQGIKGGNIQPKYDSQESIYTDLIAQLKMANDLLSTGTDDLGGGDILYGKDAMKWRKFANSLLMRIYIRMSQKSPSVAKAGIEEIMSNPGRFPVFTSNSEDAQLVYPNGQPYWNPIYDNSITRDDHGISKTMVDMLKARNDGRIAVYAEKAAASGDYVGQPNGALQQPNLNTVSRVNTKLRKNPTAPSYLMTYAELNFIKAEAALNGWNVGTTAKAAYEEGIRASFAKHGASLDSYLTGALVNYDAATNKKRAIIEQKWIALFMQGTEAYAEYRRTGFPVLQEVEGSSFKGKGIPVRFPYSTVEESLNSANLKAVNGGIESNIFGKKMWWAQ